MPIGPRGMQSEMKNCRPVAKVILATALLLFVKFSFQVSPDTKVTGRSRGQKDQRTVRRLEDDKVVVYLSLHL